MWFLETGGQASGDRVCFKDGYLTAGANQVKGSRHPTNACTEYSHSFIRRR
jgi:hypothetical protein